MLSPFSPATRLDDARDLFLPALLGDVDLIEGLVARVLFGPFPKAPDSIDPGGTEKEIDLVRQVVLEDLKKVFDARLTARSASLVRSVPKKLAPFSQTTLLAAKRPKVWRASMACEHFLEGVLRVVRNTLDDFV
jgi:hypothetical protein